MFLLKNNNILSEMFQIAFQAFVGWFGSQILLLIKLTERYIFLVQFTNASFSKVKKKGLRYKKVFVFVSVLQGIFAYVTEKTSIFGLSSYVYT